MRLILWDHQAGWFPQLRARWKKWRGKVRMVQGFSERVLGEQRRRRERGYYRGMAALGIVLLGALVYLEYRRLKLVNAPTWADFKIAETGGGGLNEHIEAYNSDGIPNTLIIGSDRFGVVRVDHFPDAETHKSGDLFHGIQAQTNCQNRVISYIPANDPRVLRENLWHEIFHAGACAHDPETASTWWNSENPDANTHPGVEHLGEFMVMFARDNPKFMEWQQSW